MFLRIGLLKGFAPPLASEPRVSSRRNFSICPLGARFSVPAEASLL